MYINLVENYRYHNLHFMDEKIEVQRDYLKPKCLSQDSKLRAQYINAKLHLFTWPEGLGETEVCYSSIYNFHDLVNIEILNQ